MNFDQQSVRARGQGGQRGAVPRLDRGSEAVQQAAEIVEAMRKEPCG